MALIQCKECGKQISSKARQCPSCGAPLPKPNGCLGCGGIVLLLFILFAVVIMPAPNAKKNGVADSTPSSSEEATETPTPEPTPTPKSVSTTGWYKTVETYPASFDLESFRKISRLISEGDKEALQEMIDRGEVFLLKPGVKVRVVETNLFRGEVKIREQGSIDEFWTVMEAIKPDEEVP